MSTLELKQRIKKKIDSADEPTLEQIDALLDQEFYNSPAYIEYRKKMPTDIVQAVLESEEAIARGDVLTLQEFEKEFEQWKKKLKAEKKKSRR